MGQILWTETILCSWGLPGDDAFDVQFKMLFVGDSEVGKSSIIARYVDRNFAPNLEHGVGIAHKTKIADIGAVRVKVTNKPIPITIPCTKASCSCCTVVNTR